ncbi:MAG: hypothetical protein LBL33_02835 [Tannerella sp.]|jgi:hypothetical protein|nr:hypothetical protein [Tannerella sp.]
MGNDYLPSNPYEFLNKMRNIRAQAYKNYSRWDISQAAILKLDAPIAAFDAAILISENAETRTSAAIAKRNLMRANLEAVGRPFIQGHLIKNPNVSDDELKAMDLPVHDRHPTPAPDPTEAPELEPAPKTGGVIEVKFRRVAGRGKPRGVKTIEISMIITDSPVPPADWTALHENVLATRSPVRITRSGHERSKWLHLAGRWVNTRGVKGPWSDIISIVIP